MVIAYLRVSTEKQHLENQQSEILRFAHGKGITVDKWVTEIVSGKKQGNDRRLTGTLQNMKPGDTLIVTELSRLSRTLMDIMGIMNTCLSKKIIIYSTKEGYAFDNDINSKVLAFAFGLVAEIEHKLISLRTKEALAVKKARGVHIGRPNGSKVKLQKLVEDRDTVLDQLKNGVTVAEICRQYDVSRGTFYNFRNNYGLPA